MSRTGPPAGLARAGGLGAKVRSWSPALMSAAASVLMTVASLAIARFDGFDAFGTLVTLQAVGVILGIPMLWGVHVNASRAMAERADAGVVAGTALAVVAAACLVTSAAFAGLLALARGVLPGGAADGLGCAAGLGVSATVMTLAESLLRIRGRQVLASGLRLGCAGGTWSRWPPSWPPGAGTRPGTRPCSPSPTPRARCSCSPGCAGHSGVHRPDLRLEGDGFSAGTVGSPGRCCVRGGCTARASPCSPCSSGST